MYLLAESESSMDVERVGDAVETEFVVVRGYARDELGNGFEVTVGIQLLIASLVQAV